MYGPTEHDSQLPVSICPNGSARKDSYCGSVTTIASAVSPDTHSARSTPELTFSDTEFAIDADLNKNVDWYNICNGLSTFDFHLLVAKLKNNWENIAPGEVISNFKRMKHLTAQYAYNCPQGNKYLIRLTRTGVTVASPSVIMNCFDHKRPEIIASHDSVTIARFEQLKAERINDLEEERLSSDHIEAQYLTRSLELAEDYNPQTSHTTPTTLKLPEMQIAPALLQELLQVLKSCAPSASDDSLTRLPSAATPEKEHADQQLIPH